MRLRGSPKSGPRGSVRRILVATDRSQTAERAVGWAAEMAERYDAELLVLQVLVADGDEAAGDGPLTERTAELTQYARTVAGDRGRARVVVDDDASRAIVAAAEEEDVDVVVVGNVAMRGRKEFLLRNVPNRVSHNAHCTVVIVNTAEPEKRAGRLLARNR